MKLTIMKNYIKLEWWEIIATRPATAKCALIVSVQYMTRHDYPVMNFDLVMNYHHHIVLPGGEWDVIYKEK